MILAWMGWTALFTAFAVLAALGGEHVLANLGLPRRGAWAVAMLLSFVVPAALAARRVDAPVRVVHAPIVGAPAIARESIAPSRETASPPVAARVDIERVAIRSWIAASVALFASIVVSFGMTYRMSRRWPSVSVDGHTVRLAPDDGPAVIGALRPTIVLPAWAMQLGASERELMLRHEAEHVRAGDPRLLLLAAVCVTLMPWNAALWYIARRLRLAIEIDCDTRVVRGSGHEREYALLLLAVGARRATALPLAASLVERRPHIERRIVAMTSRRPSRPMIASLPVLTLVLFAGILVAQVPRPQSLRPARVVPARDTVEVGTPPAAAPRAGVEEGVASGVRSGEAGGISGGVASAPPVSDSGVEEPRINANVAPPAGPDTIFNAETIRRWIDKYHPELLRGDTSNYIGFAVDEQGNVLHSAVGNDPELNDRLAMISARREAMRRQNPVIVGRDSLLPGEMPARISATRAPGSQSFGKTPILSQLHDEDEVIHRVDGWNSFAGEILDRPLEVLIVHVTKR